MPSDSVNSRRKSLLAISSVLFVLVLSLLALRPSIVLIAQQPAADPRPVDNDEYLKGGAVKTDLRPDEKRVYVQTGYYEDGKTVRVVKTMFDQNHFPHFHPDGNYVEYKFLRQDGTCEKHLMVNPTPMLGSSVIAKTHWTYFDKDGKTELSSKAYREDGTLGADFDEVKNIGRHYRMDGKTLRSLQLYDGKNTVLTYYRPDGTSAWWVFTYGKTWTCKVNFDQKGNPVEKNFERKSAGSYSMGANDPPKFTGSDVYKTAAGAIEYSQDWYHIFDKQRDDYYDALGAVMVYGADGKTVVKEIELEPRCHLDKLFVKSVRVANADGTMTVRTYQAPGVRESEEVFDASGKSTKKVLFGANDKYDEKLEPIWLQGFAHDLFGDDNDIGDK